MKHMNKKSVKPHSNTGKNLAKPYNSTGKKLPLWSKSRGRKLRKAYKFCSRLPLKNFYQKFWKSAIKKTALQNAPLQNSKIKYTQLKNINLHKVTLSSKILARKKARQRQRPVSSHFLKVALFRLAGPQRDACADGVASLAGHSSLSSQLGIVGGVRRTAGVVARAGGSALSVMRNKCKESLTAPSALALFKNARKQNRKRNFPLAINIFQRLLVYNIKRGKKAIAGKSFSEALKGLATRCKKSRAAVMLLIFLRLSTRTKVRTLKVRRKRLQIPFFINRPKQIFAAAKWLIIAASKEAGAASLGEKFKEAALKIARNKSEAIVLMKKNNEAAHKNRSSAHYRW